MRVDEWPVRPGRNIAKVSIYDADVERLSEINKKCHSNVTNAPKGTGLAQDIFKESYLQYRRYAPDIMNVEIGSEVNVMEMRSRP